MREHTRRDGSIVLTGDEDDRSEELEEDEDLEQLYLLTGADRRKLVLRVAHIWDDIGLDRPRFLDIAK